MLTSSFLLGRTTAQIAKPYVPASKWHRHEKRVDFCISIQPLVSSDRDAVKGAAGSSAHFGINHTDYTPLLYEPIGISIETKCTGEDWAEARHQISVWLAAQWRRLDGLLLRRAASMEATGGPAAELPDMTFLPGIIIQGHDWNFIAATRGGGSPDTGARTVVWHKVLIGSTTSLKGIAQIVTTVQRLARWSAFTYWPWLKKVIQPPSQ
jgi:hypothetical protein